MKCKACGQKTDKETTKIILTFSISNPIEMDIVVENKYEQLSMEMCLRNRKQLHGLLDKTLDEISSRIFSEGCKK